MSNLYRTSDFVLGSVLLAEGFRLEKLDRSNPKRVEFCFLDSDELQDTVQMFWHDELKINPRQLSLSQRTLKNYLYDSK
ncbi:hypothetical protein HZA38_03050 [Candidatus Peregrinibacteria bacterium]|nr:hypothetical protein [Candidatus Peregrinibacteria bacterium]